MLKSNQISAKVQYVTPSCKAVMLRARQAILSASNYGEAGEAGGQGGWTEDGDDY